jgi:hypothetical protein
VVSNEEEAARLAAPMPAANNQQGISISGNERSVAATWIAPQLASPPSPALLSQHRS